MDLYKDNDILKEFGIEFMSRSQRKSIDNHKMRSSFPNIFPNNIIRNSQRTLLGFDLLKDFHVDPTNKSKSEFNR